MGNEINLVIGTTSTNNTNPSERVVCDSLKNFSKKVSSQDIKKAFEKLAALNPEPQTETVKVGGKKTEKTKQADKKNKNSMTVAERKEKAIKDRLIQKYEEEALVFLELRGKDYVPTEQDMIDSVAQHLMLMVSGLNNPSTFVESPRAAIYMFGRVRDNESQYNKELKEAKGYLRDLKALKPFVSEELKERIDKVIDEYYEKIDGNTVMGYLLDPRNANSIAERKRPRI